MTGQRVRWSDLEDGEIVEHTGTVVAWVGLPPDRAMDDRKGYTLGTGFARVVAVVQEDGAGFTECGLDDLRPAP